MITNNFKAKVKIIEQFTEFNKKINLKKNDSKIRK